MSLPSGPAVAPWIAHTWAACLGDSIEMMTGARPRVESRAAQPGAAFEETALWWEQPLSMHPQAIMWIGAPEASWLAIGQHLLVSAGIEEIKTAGTRKTYLETTSKALSGLCQAISARAGKTVSCENGAESNSPAEDSLLFEIEIALEDPGPVALRLAISRGLVAALTDDSSGALDSRQPAAPERREVAKTEDNDGSTLDLLMEVELPVSVSFGRADLALKDVLKLTTGSIVELNRGIYEPVEIIVNNCVIARGDVVVIDGNYGVRVQEILSRDRRITALR